MPRAKFLTMLILAVFVATAIASSPASAHRFIDCQEVIGGEGVKYFTKGECERGENPGSGTWERVEQTGKIIGTSGVSELVSEIKKVKITISCEKDKLSGTFEKEGKSKAEITYEKCKLVGLVGCTVPNIKAKVRDKLIENGVKEHEDEFEPEGAEPFATIVIEVCVLKGSYNITGTQKCALPKGTEFRVLHEIACATGGSSLKLGPEPVTYKGTAMVEFESKESWAVE